MSHIPSPEPGPFGPPSSASATPPSGPPAPPPPPPTAGYQAPPPPTYGAQVPYGTGTGTGSSPWGELATWGPRVGAFVLDRLLSLAPLAVLGIVGGVLLGVSSRTDPLTGLSNPQGPLSVVATVLIVLGYLGVIGIEIWNRCIRTGRTGQSVGKRVLGLHLLAEQTGQPIGGAMAFVRELCHIVDGAICDIGYLFPLWDAKRQTLADKIVSTVVVSRPKQDTTPYA